MLSYYKMLSHCFGLYLKTSNTEYIFISLLDIFIFGKTWLKVFLTLKINTLGFALLRCMCCLYTLISVQSPLHSNIVCQDFLWLVCYRPFRCCLSSYYKKGSDCDRWCRTHPWGLNKSSALACKFISICGSTEIICIQISYINGYVLTSTGQLQGFILFSNIFTLALWLDSTWVLKQASRALSSPS